MGILPKTISGSKTAFQGQNASWMQKQSFCVKVHFCAPMPRMFINQWCFTQNGSLFRPRSFWPKRAKWLEHALLGPEWAFRKSVWKVKVGLSVPHREPGLPVSRPDSIHERPGLRKLVAFCVALHSNKVFYNSTLLKLGVLQEQTFPNCFLG